MPSIAPEVVRVAAAAIFNPRGEVLLARRPEGSHQAGLWEFPGGKLEPGETPFAALQRELAEELGIELLQARPLLQVPHRYADMDVHLDVWRVQRFRGTPYGREGQRIAWVAPVDLDRWPMPGANLPVCRAVQLPDTYLITPAGAQPQQWIEVLESGLASGARLIQLRAKGLTEVAFRALASKAVAMCREHGVPLLLNAGPEAALELGADGVHLTAARLMSLARRPLSRDRWVAASCHDAGELARAGRIGVDFAVLSPVLPTPSHPDAGPLGWQRFAELVASCAFPVYALGGLGRGHLATAWQHGAQGVAGISAVWHEG